MNQPHKEHRRVLGIAPSTRGFGYAVMDGENTLADWGVTKVKSDKNARCLSNVGNLIDHYTPNVLALEDTGSQGSRRSPRIKELIQEIVVLAESQNIRVERYSSKQIRHALLKDEDGTKHSVAEHLAASFPQELGLRLPPERRAWMSQDSRMDIFDAVALAEHCFKSSEFHVHVGKKPVPESPDTARAEIS